MEKASKEREQKKKPFQSQLNSPILSYLMNENIDIQN